MAPAARLASPPDWSRLMASLATLIIVALVILGGIAIGYSGER